MFRRHHALSVKEKIMKPHNSQSIAYNLFLLLACLFIISLTGCATIPPAELAIPTYNINGISYLPLSSLCDSRNINWDYDTFTRTLTLKKGGREINLSVGNSLILVDGVPRDLRFPVDIYKGAIVVPYRFKSDIIDALFKPEYYEKKAPAPYITGIKKITIDSGHGGRDPGAIGRMGLREKDVSLDITKRLKIILESYGFTVFLTRDYDKFISLEERASLANRWGSDLFISIHANANRVRSLSGLEVYYVSDKIDDSRRALMSVENVDLKSETVTSGAQASSLKATVWDIIYGQNRSESVELGRQICKYAAHNLNTNILGVKGAPFYVLKWTRMPSVLVEVGFLSNSYEEKLLRNGFYRQQLAEVIASGIRGYCQDYKLTFESHR
jgi:N-acetylmuramoyl-L-alanine amidase